MQNVHPEVEGSGDAEVTSGGKEKSPPKVLFVEENEKQILTKYLLALASVVALNKRKIDQRPDIAGERAIWCRCLLAEV